MNWNVGDEVAFKISGKWKIETIKRLTKTQAVLNSAIKAGSTIHFDRFRLETGISVGTALGYLAQQVTDKILEEKRNQEEEEEKQNNLRTLRRQVSTLISEIQTGNFRGLNENQLSRLIQVMTDIKSENVQQITMK